MSNTLVKLPKAKRNKSKKAKALSASTALVLASPNQSVKQTSSYWTVANTYSGPKYSFNGTNGSFRVRYQGYLPTEIGISASGYPCFFVNGTTSINYRLPLGPMSTGFPTFINVLSGQFMRYRVTRYILTTVPHVGTTNNVEIVLAPIMDPKAMEGTTWNRADVLQVEHAAAGVAYVPLTVDCTDLLRKTQVNPLFCKEATTSVAADMRQNWPGQIVIANGIAYSGGAARFSDIFIDAEVEFYDLAYTASFGSRVAEPEGKEEEKHVSPSTLTSTTVLQESDQEEYVRIVQVAKPSVLRTPLQNPH